MRNTIGQQGSKHSFKKEISIGCLSLDCRRWCRSERRCKDSYLCCLSYTHTLDVLSFFKTSSVLPKKNPAFLRRAQRPPPPATAASAAVDVIPQMLVDSAWLCYSCSGEMDTAQGLCIYYPGNIWCLLDYSRIRHGLSGPTGVWPAWEHTLSACWPQV